MEFLFINDASTDHSLELLLALREEDKRIKIIHLEKNYGQVVAFYLGVKYATGNYSVFISADLQEDECIVQNFISKSIQQPNADLIIGVRERNNDFILFRIFSALFYFMLHLKFNKIPKNGFDTACVNKTVITPFLDTYCMNDYIQTHLINLSKHTESILYHRQAAQGKIFKLKSILFKIRYFIQGFKQIIFSESANKNKVLAKNIDFKIKQVYN